MMNGRSVAAAAWSWAPPEPLIWSAEMARLHDAGFGSFSGKLDDYIRRIHAEDRDHFESCLWGALEQGQPSYLEYRLAMRGQTRRWLATTMHPHDSPRRRSVHGVAWDVSALEGGSAAHAAERASEADEILRMAGCAIHDLRNPLNTLLIRASAMLAQTNELPIPDGWRTSLEMVCRSVHAIQRATTDWEVYHRLQIGAPVIDAKPVLANALVQEIVDVMQTSLVTSWLKIDADRLGAHTMVVCDPRRLAHALVDLVVSAGTRSLRAADARLRFLPSAGKIAICVERHAPTSDGQRPAHTPTPLKPLPLLVAEQIIRAHGGTIAVAPGERSDVAFSFSLPTMSDPGAYRAVRTA